VFYSIVLPRSKTSEALSEDEIEDLATEFDLLIQAREEDEQLAANSIKRKRNSDARRPLLPEGDELPQSSQVFAAIPRSYRDSPLRLAEYGTDYRYERAASCSD